MIQNLFFSVIIPTLNEEVYLPKLLSDFTKQRLKNFEVIIIDANSEDKTREKALKFSKYFLLEFYGVSKRNVSFQRNFGAQKAQGKFLVFLDADCRVNTIFTGKLYADILQKKGLLFLPTLTTEVQSAKNKVLFKMINSVIELSQSLTKPLSCGGSIFIAKNLFSDLRGFRENLYMSEDHDLIQRARKIGIKANFLRDVKVAFSLRRIAKEGQVSVLYKYLLALIYMLFNGKITSKIFMYEMGGGRYRNNNLKEKWDIKGDAIKLRKILRKTSAFLVDSLS